MFFIFVAAALAISPPHALAEPLATPASAELVEATDGALWLVEDGIVQRLDTSTGEWRSLGKLADPKSAPSLVALPDGAVRLVENNQADSVISPEGTVSPAAGDLMGLALLELVPASPGKLWSSGSSGVCLYDVATGERTRLAEGSMLNAPHQAVANGDGTLLVWKEAETRRWSPDGTSVAIPAPPLEHPTAGASAAGWAWMIGAKGGRVLLTGLAPGKDTWTAAFELPTGTGAFEMWGLPDGRVAVAGADDSKIVLVDPRKSPFAVREVPVPWTALHAEVFPTSSGLFLFDGGRQDAWFDADRGAFVRSSPQVVPTAVLWSDHPLASNCPAGDRLFREDSPGLWVDVAATPTERTTGKTRVPICPVGSTSSEWVAAAPGAAIAWVLDPAALSWTQLRLPAPVDRALAGTTASWLIPDGAGAVQGVAAGALAATKLTAGDLFVASEGAAWSVTRDAIAGSSGGTGPGPGFTPMFGASPSERAVIAADLESEAVYDTKKAHWTPIEGAVHPDTMRVFDGAVYAIGSDGAVMRYDEKHHAWVADPGVPAEVSRDGAWLPASHGSQGWRWIDAEGAHSRP
jgi:hypothetical protein